MIVANLATYPARRARLPDVVHSIIGQVDRLNIVFNEYAAVPDEFRAIPGLNAVIPDKDTRDTGKFYVDVAAADWVFFIDDDILYPPDYVATTLDRIAALPFTDGLFGYHGSIYRKPERKFGLSAKRLRRIFASDAVLIQNSRTNLRFDRTVDEPRFVEQIATNSAVMAGRHVPPFSVMADAARFVDVRLASWCHRQGLPLVCLAHPGDWLTGLPYDETIFQGFTRKGHPHVGREILTYAFRTARVGEVVDRRDRAS